MPLSEGDALGPYQIVAPLGAGGMGEVYRARDTRLDRSVAIKVLPDHIAEREDARARFEREARSVASLNHPHICTLHDIGPNYMVMELIEGETLSARLERGALPLEQAIALATQIADALDRAHRAGVTHRDVKPGNIMFTRDGVKVLDFGLAKASSTGPAPDGATLTKALTTEGTLVGTPQYMAPEQFEGREADARSDIWAFGSVVYEMVTGQRAFQGKNYTSLVAAILGAEPPPMSMKPFTPSWLERLVRRCLEKDPEDRWQSMRDIVLELRAPHAEAPAQTAKASRLPWAVAAVLGVTAVALAGWTLTRTSPVAATDPMEFDLKIPGGARNVSVSPDGRQLVWRDDKELSLWIRQIDSAQPRKLEESNPVSFSWSPDGKYLAYTTSSSIKKFEVATSTITVVGANRFGNYGLTWTHDGHLLVGSSRGPLHRMNTSRGDLVTALPLDTAGGEMAQRFPQVLPDGKHVLYSSFRSSDGESGINLASLDGKGAPRRIYRYTPFRFVAPRTLLVMDTGRLLAMQLDPQSGHLGAPITLPMPSFTGFDVSSDGRVLALITGTTLPEELTLFDRSGKRLDTIKAADPAVAAHFEMSPDGGRVLFERTTGGNQDLWTVELARQVVSRLTFSEAPESPGVWSADGKKIFFRAIRADVGEGLYEMPANGTGTEKLLHKTMTHHLAVSPDGKYLMFERTAAGLGLDYIELQNGNKPGVYLNKGATSPQFSPDSRLVAYESPETGRSEIYVQTFPAGGGKWQISTNGGIEPRWRADGKELIYDQGNGAVMAAAIDIQAGSLQVTSTKELFRFRRGRSSGTAIAITPDAKTIAIRETPVGGESTIILRLNWKLGAN